MTQHCTITGTMLVPVHYIVCTLKIFFPEITVFVVVKINSLQCQCQCLGDLKVHKSRRPDRLHPRFLQELGTDSVNL